MITIDDKIRLIRLGRKWGYSIIAPIRNESLDRINEGAPSLEEAVDDYFIATDDKEKTQILKAFQLGCFRYYDIGFGPLRDMFEDLAGRR